MIVCMYICVYLCNRASVCGCSYFLYVSICLQACTTSKPDQFSKFITRAASAIFFLSPARSRLFKPQQILYCWPQLFRVDNSVLFTQIYQIPAITLNLYRYRKCAYNAGTGQFYGYYSQRIQAYGLWFFVLRHSFSRYSLWFQIKQIETKEISLFPQHQQFTVI